MGVLGSLISAGSNLLGGLLGQNSQEDALKKQIKLQKEFAQKGIQWKVADAKAAGIHPLYALGANTISYSPSAVGSDLASGLSAMGQDIGRAVDAVSTSKERAAAAALDALQLERAGLENELLRSQITGENIKNAGQLGPAMPDINNTGNPGDPLKIGGVTIKTDPNTSSGQTFENRYGDFSDWITGPAIAWQDFKKTIGDASIFSIMKWIDDHTKVFGPSK